MRALLQLSSSEGVDVVSIIVNELNMKSILRFRLLVFPAIAILKVGMDAIYCINHIKQTQQSLIIL